MFHIHKLSNYDSHFIICKFGFHVNEIKAISNSEKKFISFSKYINKTFHEQFIDTYRLMLSSLSTLASNFITSGFEKFGEPSKVFSTEDMRLVTRKGIYPYKFINNWSKLEETDLPVKKEF